MKGALNKSSTPPMRAALISSGYSHVFEQQVGCDGSKSFPPPEGKGQLAALWHPAALAWGLLAKEKGGAVPKLLSAGTLQAARWWSQSKLVKCFLNETLQIGPPQGSCLRRKANAVCTTLEILKRINGFPVKTSALVNKINSHQTPAMTFLRWHIS